MTDVLIVRDCGHRRFITAPGPMDAAQRAVEKAKPCSECVPADVTAPGIVRHDLGNNESVGTGMQQQSDGMWLCLTRTQSKWLKTEKGAVAWLARRGYAPDGTRLPDQAKP